MWLHKNHMISSILKTKNLYDFFWAKAVNMAAYIL